MEKSKINPSTRFTRSGLTLSEVECVNPSATLTSCRAVGANEHSVRGRIDGERPSTSLGTSVLEFIEGRSRTIKNQSRTFSILTKVLSFKGAGCIVILIFAFCILNFMGCATLWEGAKGFAGISTKALEDNRKTAITKTFNYDYLACYTKTLDVLKRMQAYIYTQSIKKHMIAIYVSEEDTTPVGLFFKEIDAANTQVEVSSLSTYAKEFISGKVFSVLNKKITLEELEAQIHAKKETGNK